MSLEQFAFARPLWLLALLPLALLLWHAWRSRAGPAAWQDAIDAHLLPHLLVGADDCRRRTRLTQLAAGILLAVLALAGPLVEDRSVGAHRRDATRALVVDLSPRMSEAALERARHKLLALLRELPEAETALIVYAGEPHLVVPPTTDVETIARFVPELVAGVVPAAGNRPERALAMAAQLLERSGTRSRELLWLTAGVDASPAAPPGDARVFVLHVAEADDAGLAAFAARSGGAYVRTTADDADLRALAAAGTARHAWRANDARGAQDLGPWLLLALLPLAALGFRRGLLALPLAPLLFAGMLAPEPAAAAPPLAQALADSVAWHRLQGGDAERAAADFRDARWRAAALYRAGRFGEAAAQLDGLADADSAYNRGNALAQQGRLAEALAAYEAALKLRPDDGDTRHNHDLVRKLLNQREQNGGHGGGAPPPRAGRSPANAEAERLAQQWLRSVPDEPETLLRRKLQLEHRRRLAGEAPSW